MAGQGNKLGGIRARQLLDNIVTRGTEMQDNLLESFMADGFPPLTQPVDERALLQRLTELRDANAPEFWDDPSAQRKLSQLEAKFGVTRSRPAPEGAPPEVGPMDMNLLEAANVGSPGAIGGGLPSPTPIPSDVNLLNAAGPV